MRTPFSSVFPIFATLSACLSLPAIVQAQDAAPKPSAAPAAANPAAVAPAATTPAADTATITTPEYTGPKRAGGGPTNPPIHFPLPPPRVLTAEEEIKTFKLPPGFHAELVASEPTIQAPIALSWDDQGRMYVVEMRSYMHDVDGTGEDQPGCRISRLESTKGDGVYDKATVFVDHLVLPRTVTALTDGALVNEPPNLIWYHDKSGTGVSDGKDIVWPHYATPTGQPEHMANSATWMMDNWISSANYGTDFRLQGGSLITRPTVPFGQWGNTQDDWGRQFTNSNSDLLRAHLVPPSYYLRNPHLTAQSGLSVQVMKDQTTWPSVPTPGVNRGYNEDTMKDGKLVKSGSLRMDGTLESVTATCGPAVYRANLFPAEYRGNVFIPEPAANLVKRVILTEKDAVITAANAYEGKEFLTSTDERFRPVNAYTGPDGALYIVDIARGIIQHKAFLTYYLVKNIEERKLSDPVNLGRIYRIVPDGKQAKIVRLPTETAKIPAMLTHPNGWVRDTAQRVLVERADASVVPDVKKLAATNPTPQTRVQALWTLEGLNALTPEVIAAALHDKNEKVRAAGVRIADPAASLAELVKLAGDPSAEVRLHLAFKLSGNDQPAAAKALLTLLEGSGPLFGEAAASGLSGHELDYLDTLLKLPAAEDAKLDKSTVLGTLAGCVMKERKAANVSRLLDLIAAQPAGSSRQLALLNGLAGKAASKKSKYVPRPLKLAAAPAGLAALQASKDGRIKTVVARIDPQIVWSGKPGWVEPVVVPLTASQQALYEQGKTIYSTICTACHQPTGSGMAGLAPPLVDSEWVLGQPDKIVRIVTQGLSGPIEVKGSKWELEMPGLPIFTDDQIAGILTYIRREWEHGGSAVDPAFVTKVRAGIQDHTKAWTVQELQKPVEIKSTSAK